MNNKKDNVMEASSEKEVKNKALKMGKKTLRIFNIAVIILSIVVFSAINIFANILVEKNPALIKDWTMGTYALNKVTEEYFEYLDHDITIKVLMEEEKVNELKGMIVDNGVWKEVEIGYQATYLLREMSKFSNVTLEYENIITTPVKILSEKYPDVDWGATDNMILVTDNETGKYKVLSIYDVFAHSQDDSGELFISGLMVESSVLTAIQHITSDKVVKVGLSVGNGEFFNEESGNKEFASTLTYFLEDNAYVSEEINLMTEEPADDMEVIIMMAPSSDLTPEAVDTLSLWLRNDGDYGRTFFYIPNDQSEDTPNLDLFLEQWGMKLTDGYIKENASDKTASLGDTRGDRFALMDYYDDTYTKDIRTDLKVLMLDCIPVEILDENVASPLLVSSDKATVVVASEDSSMDGTELPATGNALNGAAVGVMANEDSKKSAVVVWGSLYSLRNEFIAGDYAKNINNITYVINLLNNFSAKNGDRILVESAKFEGTSILVKSSQQATVGILFIFVIPIVIIVFGIVVWVRRRHR